MNKADKIWNEYGRLMLSVARGFFGDTPDAEDAAEDAVERILQNLDRFDEVPSPRARSLCAIITKNICLDILRRRKKLPEEPLDEEDSPPDAALSVPSAEQAWFSAKTVESARRCVAELPDGYMVITLGLPAPLYSDRVAARSQPYPRRWTHHIVVSEPEDLDEELFSWVGEAYAFADAK